MENSKIETSKTDFSDEKRIKRRNDVLNGRHFKKMNAYSKDPEEEEEQEDEDDEPKVEGVIVTPGTTLQEEMEFQVCFSDFIEINLIFLRNFWKSKSEGKKNKGSKKSKKRKERSASGKLSLSLRFQDKKPTLENDRLFPQRSWILRRRM